MTWRQLGGEGACRRPPACLRRCESLLGPLPGMKNRGYPERSELAAPNSACELLSTMNKTHSCMFLLLHVY